MPVSNVRKVTFTVMWAGAFAAAAALMLAPDALAKGRGKGGKRSKAKVEAVAPAAATPAGSADASFIVKAADAALASRDFALAVSLWQGVVAIKGDGDPAMRKLAEAWALNGEYARTSDVLLRYAQATTDPAEQKKARADAAGFAGRTGFASNEFRLVPATDAASECYKRGERALKAKRYGEAVQYFQAGIVMAPEMPGNYRMLAAAYKQLGKNDQAIDFYTRAFNQNPYGKFAPGLLKDLKAAKHYGTLDVSATGVCEELWVEGRKLDPKVAKLPIKGKELAPGRYDWLCVNYSLYYAERQSVVVPKGGKASLKFEWAVIENKVQPWARLTMENPFTAGEMKALSLAEEVAVPVPPDRRLLKLRMEDGTDKTHVKEELIKVEPGKRIVLKW